MENKQIKIIGMILLLLAFIPVLSTVSAINDTCPVSVYVQDYDNGQEICFNNNGEAKLFLNDAKDIDFIEDFGFAFLHDMDMENITINDTLIIKSDEVLDEEIKANSTFWYSLSDSMLKEINYFNIVVGGDELFKFIVNITDVTAPKTDNNVPDEIQLSSFVVTLNSSDSISGVSYINWSFDGENYDQIFGDEVSIPVIEEGGYTIYYYAVDNAKNIEESKSVTFTLKFPIVTTSSGGGSGGTCTTEWIVGEWSECIGGIQTRAVTFNDGWCTPIATKPVETQSCEVSGSSSEDEEETTSETSEERTGGLAGITGAVIGTATGRWSLGILIFLIILGLAWWIIAKKKKKTTKKGKK